MKNTQRRYSCDIENGVDAEHITDLDESLELRIDALFKLSVTLMRRDRLGEPCYKQTLELSSWQENATQNKIPIRDQSH